MRKNGSLTTLMVFWLAVVRGAGWAPQEAPITLAVDATKAPRRLLHARLTLPVNLEQLSPVTLIDLPAAVGRRLLLDIRKPHAPRTRVNLQPIGKYFGRLLKRSAQTDNGATQ